MYFLVSLLKVCTRIFSNGDKILRVCTREFLPENDFSFKQFFSTHLEQSMKCRSLRIKSSRDVTLEYSSNAAGMLNITQQKIDYCYWFLRKMTGISDHIRLNRSYAKVVLKIRLALSRIVHNLNFILLPINPLSVETIV